MVELILEENLSEPTWPKGLVLDTVVFTTEAASTVGRVYWRFNDEPDAAPQILGDRSAGSDLVIPFDLKGHAIRLFLISVSQTGNKSVSDIKKAVQTVFQPPVVAVLADATFDTGTDDVTLTITNNGGGGDIHIFRQLGSEGFAEIASVSFSTPSYVDSPPIDGTYQYKLTQDGLEGESNTLEVVASTIGGGTGTAPTDLTGDWDSDLVTLAWVNHGGTGNNIVERKFAGGAYAVDASLASSSTGHTDGQAAGPHGRWVYYRVTNESVTGYSNELGVFIPPE